MKYHHTKSKMKQLWNAFPESRNGEMIIHDTDCGHNPVFRLSSSVA